MRHRAITIRCNAARVQAKQYLQGLRGTLGLFLRKALPEQWEKLKMPADPKVDDTAVDAFVAKLASKGFIGATVKEHFKCVETGTSNADVKKVLKRAGAGPQLATLLALSSRNESCRPPPPPRPPSPTTYARHMPAAYPSANAAARLAQPESTSSHS